MSTELIYSDATKLAELIRTREVSPVEVMKAHLDRIDRCLAQSRIVDETQMIVRRQIDQLSPRDLDFGPLRATDFAKMSV